MAASTTRAMRSTQCATTPSLHALHNTPMKLLFVRVALYQVSMTGTCRNEEGPAVPSWRTPGSPPMGSPHRDLVVRRETGQESSVRVRYDEGVAIHVGPEPCVS